MFGFYSRAGQCQLNLSIPIAKVDINACHKLAWGLNTRDLAFQTDHFIGASAHVPQRSMVTYTRMDTVSDRGLSCHEFESSTIKDPPCRAAMHVKYVEKRPPIGVVVRRGGASSGVVHVKIMWSVTESPRVAGQCNVNIQSINQQFVWSKNKHVPQLLSNAWIIQV
ncbi:hypothetical protein TNCV_3743311 [Trichonephila clavipes]|nr:hypothetical protein TNCV_3743311 [Trichonephila clavipes]